MRVKRRDLRVREYVRGALLASQYAALVANYCDHQEHNEPAEREWVLQAASGLRSLALELACFEEADPIGLYADRLRAIELRNALRTDSSPDCAELVRAATTWRELQVAQLQHDRHYHPDVFGLAKFDQLRHYALHIAKIAGAFSRLACEIDEADDVLVRRVPDALLFGVKLSTAVGEALPSVSLTEIGAGQGELRVAHI